MKETLKLVRIADTTEGQGAKGQWRKTTAVFETTGDYPKTIAISAFNSHIDELLAIPVGSTCEVSFDIASREYGNKWYTDCTMFKIEQKTEQQPAPQPAPQPKPQPAPKQANMFDAPQGGDDLPF